MPAIDRPNSLIAGTRAFELGLTEPDLDNALDEATEQNTKPKEMIMRAVLSAEVSFQWNEF